VLGIEGVANISIVTIISKVSDARFVQIRATDEDSTVRLYGFYDSGVCSTLGDCGGAHTERKRISLDCDVVFGDPEESGEITCGTSDSGLDLTVRGLKIGSDETVQLAGERLTLLINEVETLKCA
jgi:hypothetical protein